MNCNGDCEWRVIMTNEEIYKEFSKRIFLESEDVLGNDMVDVYHAKSVLAELLGINESEDQ